MRAWWVSLVAGIMLASCESGSADDREESAASADAGQCEMVDDLPCMEDCCEGPCYALGKNADTGTLYDREAGCKIGDTAYACRLEGNDGAAAAIGWYCSEDGRYIVRTPILVEPWPAEDMSLVECRDLPDYDESSRDVEDYPDCEDPTARPAATRAIPSFSRIAATAPMAESAAGRLVTTTATNSTGSS